MNKTGTSITYRLMHELIRAKTFILLGRYYVLARSVPSFDNQVVVMDELIKEAKESLKEQGYKV